MGAQWASLPPAWWIAAAAVLGAVVGSFLNVVIYRLPVMLQRQWRTQCEAFLSEADSTEIHRPQDEPAPASEPEPFNLATPASRCPHCGAPIRPWQNIPVLSYLWLRGRCAHCQAGISPRYPAIEALSALCSALVIWRLGPTGAGGAAMLLTWAFIALTFIDVDHQLLPDDITLPFLWLGLGLNLFGVFTDLHSSVIGAMAGYLSLWGVYHLFRLLTRKEGMGYGDFKLLAVIGAWLGWQALPITILLSSLVGAVVGVGLILLRRHGRDVPIPFGPYLAGAGWIALLWGHDITQAYLRWAGL